MNSIDSIIAPFPAKENTGKSTMESSTTSTNATTSSNSTDNYLRFDPKFNHLPAPSDDRLDSGIDSYRSDFCPSGGLDDLEETLKGLRLQQPNTEEQTTSGKDNVQNTEGTECEQQEIQLTSDAFDQDQEGDTPLHLAIIHEDEVSLQFIKYAPSVYHLNITNSLIQTPLHLTVHTKQHTACRALVAAGVPLETMDRHGNTALHLACSQGNGACLKALTQKVTNEEQSEYRCRKKMEHNQQLPQNLELRNFDGFTCMHLAAASEHLDIVCFLRSMGAQIDAIDGKSGRTALHHAVEANNFNLVQYLINLGANINAVTFDYCTALHLAVGRGLQRIMLLLLQHGADINALNSEGLSAAELAINQHTTLFLEHQPEYNDFQLN